MTSIIGTAPIWTDVRRPGRPGYVQEIMKTIIADSAKGQATIINPEERNAKSLEATIRASGGRLKLHVHIRPQENGTLHVYVEPRQEVSV